MTIEEMRRELWKYCDGFEIHQCGDKCRLRCSDGGCRWDDLSDESTEDCYWFLVNEGLISKPKQP